MTLFLKRPKLLLIGCWGISEKKKEENKTGGLDL
jgi:hypothetical protein